MGRTAIIGGTVRADLSGKGTEKKVRTRCGTVKVREVDGIIFLDRHDGGTVPPHRINHEANLLALKKLGVERIVALSSVGSLRKGIRPGSLLLPDDFLSLGEIPTIHHDRCIHVIPEFDQGLRRSALEAAKRLGIRIVPHGTYCQTRGPRLETKAEIRLLQGFGDVVGMTVASEATVAKEAGIAYIALCSVDNYCHGVAAVTPSHELIRKNAERNRGKMLAIARAVSEGRG